MVVANFTNCSARLLMAFSLAWLLNPFVQNTNLFEFHLLPFVLLPLFFAVYYYLKNNFKLWLLFSFLALRE